MKHGFTLLLWLLIVPAAWSQNNLFIPFGQSTEEVKDFLNTRDYILAVHEDHDMQRMRADLTEGKHVEYAFRDGSLYSTTVTRNYPDRKLAKEIQKNCLDYMRVISRGAMQDPRNGKVICYTAITDSKLLKLFIIEHEDSQTLSLTAVSREYGPMTQDVEFFYEVQLLQRRFISN